MLTGSDRPLVVRVYGQDLAIASPRGEQGAAASCRRSTASSTRVWSSRSTQPTVEIEVDLDRARRFGIKPGDVRRAEATLIQGIHVGSVFEEQKVFDVVVEGVPATRRSVASVRNLLLDTPGGGHVRLGERRRRAGERPPVVDRA